MSALLVAIRVVHGDGAARRAARCIVASWRGCPSYLDGSFQGTSAWTRSRWWRWHQLAPHGTLVRGHEERKTRLVMMNEYERKRKVAWMREAEIKHARLAMMAAVGWPVSEIIDGPLSKLLGMPNVMEATNGRAPSLLNGHLFDGPQGGFLLLVALAKADLEANTLDNVEGLTSDTYIAGDLGFDPLGLREKRADMALSEIKHGRVAMLAVAGYVAQEAIYRTPVIAVAAEVSRRTVSWRLTTIYWVSGRTLVPFPSSRRQPVATHA